MQNKKIFRDGQDIDPTDFNDLQDYAAQTFDDLVYDAVSPTQRYAGMQVTKSGTTGVNVAAGRLYSSGKMFVSKNIVPQDFLTKLPTAGKKYVTVVAYGTTQDTDVTAREFLINEETGQSQPKPVATRTTRIANIQFAEGQEAPSPTVPLIDAGYTAIADILLTTTGVGQVVMRSANALSSIDGLGSRISGLESFETAVGPKVTSLSSDLASVSSQLAQSASNNTLAQVLMRLATLEAKTGIPTTNSSSHADYYLTADKVDLTHPLSNCKIKEGIRFPDANANYSQLGLLNPIDVGAKVINGVLFPNYTRKLWMSTGTPSDQVRIAGFSYQTNNLVQKTMSRQVVQYGAAFDVCTNSAFWQSGNYDPIAGVFTRNGEKFKAQLDLNGMPYIYSADGFMHVPMRVQQYWVDTVQDTYWDTVKVDHPVNGAFVAESFLQGQDIWLDAIGLTFTKLADSGDATIGVMEVSKQNGLPDVSSVIGITTLTRANMNAGVETVIPITPTFLEAGKRYAVFVVTTADHWLATVPGEQFTAGTFFYILDGAYAQGDGTKDLAMRLYRAVPNATRSSIQLNPLSLDGGILGIKINADAVIPSQCSLAYEIQVDGRWYALEDVDKYKLGQGGAVLPLLPFRITFIGSADMMPAVTLSGSEVKLSRPGTVAVCVTQPVSVPSTSQIHVIQRYENWSKDYHTASLQLRTGGTPADGAKSYGTLVNPSSYTDTPGVDQIAGMYVERHYVFNLPNAVTSFCAQTNMATQSNRLQFHVAFEKDYEL